MVSGLFHSPPGVLFTFPSRYLFTIDLSMYLALPVSTGGFTRAIHVQGYSRVRTKKWCDFRIQDYHLLWLYFPVHSSNHIFCNFSHRKDDVLILQPPPHKCDRFGLLPFRSPLLWEYNICFFSFRYWDVSLPWVRECMSSMQTIKVYLMRFPHSEIFGSKVVWHLPEAYRSRTTSFIAIESQGIRHMLLRVPIRNTIYQWNLI